MAAKSVRQAPQEVESDGEFICFDCGAMFVCETRLRLHRSCKHGERRPAFNRVSGGCCPFCDVDFRTRQRLIHHLSRFGNKVCAARVCELPALSSSELAECIAQDAVVRRAQAASGEDWTSGLPALRPPPQGQQPPQEQQQHQ